MNKTILDRYPRAEDGTYVIDISAGRANDLYDDFDRKTPYRKKELDQHLVEYISDSANELNKKEFIIRFSLSEPPSDELQERITTSVISYFEYIKTLEINELKRAIRSSLIYLLLGIAILFLSVWVNHQLDDDTGVITKVFAEGLTVAAWVSMWEALATFIINWPPYSRKIKIYDRIANAAIQFAK